MKPIFTDNPILRAIAKPVSAELFGSKELIATLQAMSEALKSRGDGVALAAPQIGVSQRIFIVSGKIFAEEGEQKSDQEFINPVIKKTSRKKRRLEEGCLSVPNLYGFVKRAEKVTVAAHDRSGKKFERSSSGLLAQIFQHETDHLDGVLFIDHATNIHDTRKN